MRNIMNAQEQYTEWATKREELVVASIKYPFSYPNGQWDAIAERIISDQMLKIQAYGDKAYPASEKQAKVVAEFFARWEAKLEESRRWAEREQEQVSDAVVVASESPIEETVADSAEGVEAAQPTDGYSLPTHNGFL